MLARFFYAFGLGPKVQNIRFYMKSGNSFLVDRVTKCDWTYTGDRITRLSLLQRSDARFHIQVTTIALDQIEAVILES